MKTAFITGITGFVGSHLADYLLTLDNIEVHGMCRWRSPKDNIKHCLDKIHLHHADLTDLASMQKVIQYVYPNYIFHLAAQSVAEDEFLAIMKSKEIKVMTFFELWNMCKKHNKVENVIVDGIETEVIHVDSKQIRSIGYFNGMGNWVKITQISRHKYSGDIVLCYQKFGSIAVTPNHCLIDRYGKLCSTNDKPDLFGIRKLNYYNKSPLRKVQLRSKKRYKRHDDYFSLDNVPEKKIPILLSDKSLRSFVLFCAAYIAEGCASSRTAKPNFVVTISNQDKDWLKKINDLLHDFSQGMNGRFVTSKKDGYKDVYNLNITSELLYDIITRYCGKGSCCKQIPDFVFRLDSQLQQEFINKMVEGDGCIQKWKSCYGIRYTTASKKLAAQFCLLLNLLGRDFTVHFADNAYFIRECQSYQRNQGVESKKFIKRDYDGYVYDIGVDAPNHLFAAGVGNLVVHNSYVPYSFDVPAATLEANVIGTCNLLEAVKVLKLDSGYDPIFHCCSSSEVYGQVKEDELPITEDNVFRPASPYAVSKVGEDMLALQYWLSYGIKTIRTRMFTHTGERRGEFFVVSNFAKQIAEIEDGKRVSIIKVGNLDSVRTFADVRDTVRAYWLLVNRCEPGEVYNIGGETTMTIGEMLNKLIDLSTKKDIKIEVDPSRLRPSDVTLQIPCIDKFKKATGWQPVIPFDQTLIDILNYWREKIK